MTTPKNFKFVMMMKQQLILFSALCTFAFHASAQKVYEITEPEAPMQIVEGKLDMGGTSPTGGSIQVNSFYMTIDGKPAVPVLGEFHYSRYPREQWEEQIMKMKAGGITVIPTYVFWSLHEEYEGQWRWDGNLDLRHFLNLCKKHGMGVILRIGPFCHGEVRNGAIPDWVFAKPLEIRSNDPAYLRLARELYHQIGEQTRGLYYKDGGPVIGCQIENEMQHSAAPWGINYPGEAKDNTAASWNSYEAAIGVEGNHKKATGAEAGNEHMRTLLRMAQEEGIVAPFYTATGWGNAAVIDNKAIPVTAAYTYPFWAKPHMSKFMMFKDLHKSPDYSPVRYDPQAFPSFSAELGVGIQMIYSSRPIVTAKAAEALAVRVVGSGSNGIGYYMYQGGSTPRRDGDNAFFCDEPMGVTKISYDYQAPLGEFGLEHGSYRTLRLVHSFLGDWGDVLAPMETVLPEGWDKMTPGNHDDLRCAARMKDGSGFVFMINFQDHDTTRVDQKDLQLKLNLRDETLRIPSQGTFTLPKDESMILPFNLDMEGARLKYAMAQPLMKIDDRGATHYFFFAPEGVQPEYRFDAATVRGKDAYRVQAGLKSTFSVRTAAGKTIKITTLTRGQALDACKVDGKLLITKATVLPDSLGARLLSLGENTVQYVAYPGSKGFKAQTATVEPVSPQCQWSKRGPRRMSVHFNDSITAPQVQEYFMQVDYVGDVAMAFIDGQLCQDEFWHGEPWTIGLKRYKQKMHTQDMTFYIRPLNGKLPFVSRDLSEQVRGLDFSKGPVVDIRGVRIVPEYVMRVKL